MFTEQVETYIHAARASVWTMFTDVHKWHQWHPKIEEGTIADDMAWAEGTTIMVRSTVLGFIPVSLLGRIQMTVPQMSAVIEWHGIGIEFIDAFQFTDDLGGCRVRLRRTVHGPIAFLLRPLPSVLQGHLRQWTQSLREAVEKPRGSGR